MTTANAIAVCLWLALGLLAAGPADAESDDETSARLDALFGAHEPYRTFLAALKEEAATGDREAVGAMVAYPLETTIAGHRVTLELADSVVRRYDQLFTPAVVAAIERQTYATLFANAEGVMIGDGKIWFSGICVDQACSEASVKIIALSPSDEPAGTKQ